MNNKEYEYLKNIAINKMSKIKDPEHGLEHVEDVLFYSKILLKKLEGIIDFDPQMCLLIAYWHDVGRTIKDKGHEKISSDMLKEEMIKLKFDDVYIDKVYKSIVNHKWNMNPTTIEGKILKDADKLAWVGLNRWKKCLLLNKNMNHILELLPNLKNEILFFKESKEIYDESIIKLLELLYKNSNINLRKTTK